MEDTSMPQFPSLGSKDKDIISLKREIHPKSGYTKQGGKKVKGCLKHKQF